MANELIRNIRSLQELQEDPQPVHWFCPRRGPQDGGLYFEEDLLTSKNLDTSDDAVQARKKVSVEAKSRAQLAMSTMAIFAFDDQDALPLQKSISEHLRDETALCDVCSREFHRGRPDLEQKLRESYDDDAVAEFMLKFDMLNLDRIKKNLASARDVLRALPPESRGLSELGPVGLHAIFEALNCYPALTSDEFLREYFDELFSLVQTKKRLKAQIYTPAMASFLFQTVPIRHDWAKASWATFRRTGSLYPTRLEFEHSVRIPLTAAMSRVQLQDLDVKFVPRFWAGARAIVMRLNQDLITHSLRALDYDICKLALDHLQLESDGFLDLLQTSKHILEVSPADFWEAMGTTPANVWIEQFFNSKALPKFVEKATQLSIFDQELLQNLFAWMGPFFASIKTVNQPAASRGALSQLLGSIQNGDSSQRYKDFCFQHGLNLLTAVLEGVGDKKAISSARAAGLEALDLVESHAEMILAATSADHQFAEPSARVIRLALTLDCEYILADRIALLSGKQPQPGFCTYRINIWKPALRALSINNTGYAKDLLSACSSLIAAEPFKLKADISQPDGLERFNITFDAVNRCVVSMLERISDFDTVYIQDLLSESSTSTALIAHLFSSDIDVRTALLELLKAVSGENVRGAAIFAVTKSHLATTLEAFSNSLRKISLAKMFSAATTLWVNCKDLLEALFNSTDGILRTSHHISFIEAEALEKFWAALWDELTTVFGTTEDWSYRGNNKTELMEFCRNAMDFADYTFDQFAVVTGTLGDGVESSSATRNAGKRIVAAPKASMDVAGKWLRLRDSFLLDKSTELICKLLERLKQFETAISESALTYIKNIYTGEVRNNLTQKHKAELRRAWESHTGRSMQPQPQSLPPPASKPKTAQVIDLETWRSNAQAAASKPLISGQQKLDSVIANSTRGLEAFKAQQAQRPAKSLPTGLSKPPPRAVDSSEFMKKREAEKAAFKKQKLEAIALAKRRANAAHTAEEGSGLAGLGVYGVDHSAPKGEGVMVSSDEESEDSDDDMDAELFGTKNKSKTRILDPEADKNAEALRQAHLRKKPQGPVKKQRINRNARDMRARLAPDLSSLHQSILAWDYFYEGPFPPGSGGKDYAAVLDAFRDPVDYQRTFEPLLLLEAWNGFLKAKEDMMARAVDVKVLNRSNVDAFVEMSSSINHSDGREMLEGDIVLLSRAQDPTSDASSPHAIARVHRMSRKKAHVETLFRLLPRTSLLYNLAPGNSLRAIKVTSITPLEREYGALLGLQYYDLCDEITRAKPSPLLEYSDESLQRLTQNYQVNKAQAKAIKSALDNDAFTLVQGPPGSGKTKTIVAIVGAILSDSLRMAPAPRPTGQPGPAGQQTAKKLLVCAPSNAAVDELVLRFKQGVKTTSGEHKPLNVVRLGKSDAISSSVLDVTLDVLVNKRLDPTNNQELRDETQKIMKQHQEISAKLREARLAVDEAEKKKASTEELTLLRKEADELRKSKNLLSTRIDSAKDNEGSQSRLAEQRKRQVQQEVIGEAHVICATLSGSGHDMFQNMNIEFETVVIDEAAQCVELSALIPLKYGCAKCILVGDPQQLPPTVLSKEAARFKYEQSLFVRMQKNHPNDVHLLDTQYRMHPEISKFPSQAFYDGRLLDGPDMASLRKQAWHAADLLGPFRFFDVQGQHQAAPKGHSLVNYAEVRVAIQLYTRLKTDFRQIKFDKKIGIITPYKSQLRELKDQFRRQFGEQITDVIEFNTTDAFQGRESEIIIFSCVRASPSGGVGFLQDIRRMNVGLTRAKSSLWVLGNSGSLLRGEYWAKLIGHAKASNRFTDGDIERLFRQKLTINPDVEMMEAPEEVNEEVEPEVPFQPLNGNRSANTKITVPPTARDPRLNAKTALQTTPTDSSKQSQPQPQPPRPPQQAPHPPKRKASTDLPAHRKQPPDTTPRSDEARRRDSAEVPSLDDHRQAPAQTGPSTKGKQQQSERQIRTDERPADSSITSASNSAKSAAGMMKPKAGQLPASLRKKDVNVFMPKKKRF